MTKNDPLMMHDSKRDVVDLLVDLLNEHEKKKLVRKLLHKNEQYQVHQR